MARIEVVGIPAPEEPDADRALAYFKRDRQPHPGKRRFILFLFGAVAARLLQQRVERCMLLRQVGSLDSLLVDHGNRLASRNDGQRRFTDQQALGDGVAQQLDQRLTVGDGGDLSGEVAQQLVGVVPRAVCQPVKGALVGVAQHRRGSDKHHRQRQAEED